MPSDSVLLPLTISLALAFLVIGVILWIRGHHGRALRWIGLAAGTTGLYLTGLLSLVWTFVTTIGQWVQNLVLSPLVWSGVALLGLMVVLWVIGGFLKQRRTAAKARGELPGRASRRQATQSQPAVGASRTNAGRTGAGTGRTGAAPASSATPTEDDEIEAILRKRGIS